MDKAKSFFKELRENKRKRAIVSLIFWFIFIFVVIKAIGRPPAEIYQSNGGKTSNTNTTYKTGKETLKNSNSFEFEYKIDVVLNNKNYSYVLNGTYYDGKNYFIYDNNEYYVKDQKIYLVDKDNRKLILVKSKEQKNLFGLIDVNILLKDSLYTLIDYSTEESKTTYKDGNVVVNYLYSSSDNKKISITTTEDNGLINSIVLELKNYFLDKNYTSFKATCSLKNVNNIAEYNRNYDDYKIEGE